MQQSLGAKGKQVDQLVKADRAHDMIVPRLGVGSVRQELFAAAAHAYIAQRGQVWDSGHFLVAFANCLSGFFANGINLCIWKDAEDSVECFAR